MIKKKDLEKYIDTDATFREMGKDLGVSGTYVHRLWVRFGLPIRTRYTPKVQRLFIERIRKSWTEEKRRKASEMMKEARRIMKEKANG